MTSIECDVAIIGAGTAGLAAYHAATKAGAQAVLIDAGPGGTTCARVGCMPSKALIAAGRAAHAVRQAAQFGVDAGTPRIDGAAVMARVRSERDYFVASVLDDVAKIPPERRIAGRACFTGPDTLAITGGPDVRAGAIVIAVGSSPAIPDMLEPVRDSVRTSDTIFDLADLPASLAVLGAGPVGLELAAAFARLGTRVTVIDAGQTIGGLKDAEASRFVQDRLSQDFAILLDTELAGAEPAADGVRLRWTGADADTGTFALVLAAAGRPPAMAGLDLARAGIALDDDGIPHFDAGTGRCGDSAIFMAGDARGCRPVLHEAARSGTLAGHNAASPKALRRQAPLPRFSIVYTDPQIATVGDDGDAVIDGGITGAATFEDNGRVHIDALGSGVLRLHADSDGRLLGATIVGPEAEYAAHLVAIALDAGLTLGELADQPYYHPTVAEVVQQAARDGMRQLEAADG